MLSAYGKKVMDLGTAVIALAILTELLRPRNNTARLIETMNRSNKLMVQVALGNIPITPKTDVLGNVHAPDEVGYCACWDCPKWDGVEWWTPKGFK